MSFERLAVLFLATLIAVSCDPAFLRPAWSEEGKHESSKEADHSRVKRPKKKAESGEKSRSTKAEKGAAEAKFKQSAEDLTTVDAILLIDASGSMLRTDPQRLRDQASKLFVRFLADGDRVAIFQFDRDILKLLDFVQVNSTNLTLIEQAISKAGTDGRFTDFEPPVLSAFELLQSQGRRDARKCVILLSDGQLDPHPSKGTSEEVRERLLQEELPKFRQARIKLYTVALSPEADSQLLNEMAKATDGLSWTASDAETVHLRFSDLFLALKKPQTVDIDKGGFEIDSRVDEATFYITRKDPQVKISLLSPSSESMDYLTAPLGVKWFHGELFDIVTIKNPTAGIWSVEGIEDPKGYATLLTDLKLQVQFAKSNLNLGEQSVIQARLVSEGKTVNEPEMKSMTFFNYKVLDTQSGGTVGQGVLKDDGQNGDGEANDGIYSATLKFESEGQLKVLVGVTSATFSRQQQVPFSVEKGAVQVTRVAADSFAGTPEKFVVSVNGVLKKLKELEVSLAVKADNSEKTFLYKLQSSEGGNYEFLASKLKPGRYSIRGKVVGKEAKKSEMVKEQSEALAVEIGAPKAGTTKDGVKHGGEENAHEGEGSEVEASAGSEAPAAEGEEVVDGEEVAVVVDEGESEGGSSESESGADTGTITGIVCVILSLLWSGGALFYVFKKVDFGKNLPAREKPYSVPEDLKKEIDTLRAGSSTNRRMPTDVDREVFEILGDIYPAEVTEAPPAEAPPAAT